MTSGLLSPTHLLFIVGIALLVLGPKRLPEVARSLGKGIRDFKDSINGGDAPLFGNLHDVGREHEAAPPQVTPVPAQVPAPSASSAHPPA